MPTGMTTAEATRYQKKRRLDELNGITYSRPLQGTLRRIQALWRLGYSSADIARESGLPKATVDRVFKRGKRFVWVETADRIAEAYERLCMTVPEGPYHERQRQWAIARGYPGPLAWDDIDNDEKPQGNQDWRRWK